MADWGVIWRRIFCSYHGNKMGGNSPLWPLNTLTPWPPAPPGPPTLGLLGPLSSSGLHYWQRGRWQHIWKIFSPIRAKNGWTLAPLTPGPPSPLAIWPPWPPCTVCLNGFYADIWIQRQLQQYKSCLKSIQYIFGCFEVHTINALDLWYRHF